MFLTKSRSTTPADEMRPAGVKPRSPDRTRRRASSCRAFSRIAISFSAISRSRTRWSLGHGRLAVPASRVLVEVAGREPPAAGLAHPDAVVPAFREPPEGPAREEPLEAQQVREVLELDQLLAVEDPGGRGVVVDGDA